MLGIESWDDGQGSIDPVRLLHIPRCSPIGLALRFSLNASPLNLLPLSAVILPVADIVYLWSQRRHVASPGCSQNAATWQRNNPSLPQNPEAVEDMRLQRASDSTLHLCETFYHEWGLELSLRPGSSFIQFRCSSSKHQLPTF
jgi:hypothetical protein